MKWLKDLIDRHCPDCVKYCEGDCPDCMFVEDDIGVEISRVLGNDDLYEAIVEKLQKGSITMDLTKKCPECGTMNVSLACFCHNCAWEFGSERYNKDHHSHVSYKSKEQEGISETNK